MRPLQPAFFTFVFARGNKRIYHYYTPTDEQKKQILQSIDKVLAGEAQTFSLDGTEPKGQAEQPDLAFIMDSQRLRVFHGDMMKLHKFLKTNKNWTWQSYEVRAQQIKANKLEQDYVQHIEATGGSPYAGGLVDPMVED